MNDNDLYNHAYTISQSTCALIEALGMVAENMQREHRNESMAFVGEDFLKLIDQYSIHHNAVVGAFRHS